MKNIIICILCAAVVIVLDIVASKKIWKTLLDYAGITFEDMRKHFEDENIHFPSGSGLHGKRNSMRYRQRAITEYLVTYADNPDASLKLFNLLKYSSLPIPIAASIAFIEKFASSNIVYAIIAYCVLLLAVFAFLLALNRFKKNNPIDESKLERLENKRDKQEKPNLRPAKIFFAVVAVIMIGATVFMMLATNGNFSSTTNSEPEFHRLDISDSLYARGYNSSEVMATYWEFDSDKLDNLALGEKDGYRFEYYEYNDDKTTADVYNSIINDIAPNVEHGPGSVFTIVLDGVYYYVEYKSNTVIFAYSPDGSNEIKQILDSSGYSAWNSVDDITEEQGASQSNWVVGIVVCFMMLIFTLIVRGSCMAVVFASSNTRRSKFDETDLKMTERLKIMNENSKRPFITHIYTFAYYAAFLPWIAFCVLGFASYFSPAAQAAFSKYSFWGYAASFIFTVFNYIFSGFLNNSNSN